MDQGPWEEGRFQTGYSRDLKGMTRKKMISGDFSERFLLKNQIDLLTQRK
jgi:hypothetical protein